jgi:hypothetical protein
MGGSFSGLRGGGFWIEHGNIRRKENWKIGIHLEYGVLEKEDNIYLVLDGKWRKFGVGNLEKEEDTHLDIHRR